MTNQQYEIRLAASCYFQDNTTVIVPPYYYDHIVNAYNHSKLEWRPDQAAALALFSAFYDGVLQLSELTIEGHDALCRAEEYLREGKIQIANKQQEKSGPPSGVGDKTH